ncbi:BLUF domain-containing protein [Hymenobacter sp. H14-R3]|uniref:BLUF domain-containing protein n=1 Tax=Hymenobacter sp. H14-R3 TaxID=3046308 RepID=UPI0024BB1170|nr:BLUF domain-containing protein [Hymenobacter sp. H14-R3]MDJ0367608.1 BLUF domain-containing protein [Hymenobacter sp. H14-R3]
MSLYHLIYESQATQAFSETELLTLLHQARQYNTAQQVTGLLLQAPSGRLIQVLEGERGLIEALYQRIARDPRHTRCTILASGTLPARRFGEWRMGFRATSEGAHTTLLGYVDTASAAFLLPLLPVVSRTLLTKLLDYVRHTPPHPLLQ